MPEAQRDAHGAAGITCRGLNPDLIEHLLAHDPPVAHAVERDAAGQAQVAHAGLLPREARCLEHHLFGDLLDRSREIHLALRQLRLGLPCRALEEPFERGTRHRQPGGVREVLHVHPQAAVVTNLEQVVLDGLDVLRLAVRGEAHHFVLAGVDLEAREIRKRRIEQPERMRKPQLADELDFVAPADADRRGGPLAHAVHGDDGRLFERRWVERRRSVRLVVFAEQDLALETLELLADVVGHPQPLAQPERHRHQV